MINILLVGCNGKMGGVISNIVESTEDVKIACGYDINTNSLYGYPVYNNFTDIDRNIDVIIDFSHPSCFNDVIKYAVSNKIPAVICTTGLDNKQKERLLEASKETAVFFSANMSIGVNLLIELANRAASLLEDSFDIEIVEKHHNLKIDAPSGTALAIADEICKSVSSPKEYVYDRHSVRKKRDKREIGIHSVRGGTIVGEHSVIFAGRDEVIELKHQAASKEVFAVGAVRAAKFMAGKEKGLYNMKNLVETIDL